MNKVKRRAPYWVAEEERVARDRARRGCPTPATARYQKFIEERQRQQRLPFAEQEEEEEDDTDGQEDRSGMG
jgi:hypothetical protein